MQSPQGRSDLDGSQRRAARTREQCSSRGLVQPRQPGQRGLLRAGLPATRARPPSPGRAARPSGCARSARRPRRARPAPRTGCAAGASALQQQQPKLHLRFSLNRRLRRQGLATLHLLRPGE